MNEKFEKLIGALILAILVICIYTTLDYVIYISNVEQIDMIKQIDKEFSEQNYLCDKLNSVDKEWFTYRLRTKDGHITCTLIWVEAP